MATERQVRKSGKNRDGDITSVCNDGEWRSPRATADAIRDIEGGSYAHYVDEESPRACVRAVASMGVGGGGQLAIDLLAPS